MWRSGLNWWGWGTGAAVPPTGQVPRASRYRTGGRVDWMHPSVLILVPLGGLVWFG